MFAIQARRISFGIPKFEAERVGWLPEEIALLGKYPDEKIARKLNRTLAAVKVKRGKLGIRRPDPKRRRSSPKEDRLPSHALAKPS
jgi:hypothetical protein